ncbi:MAG: hypothetical protein ACK5NY_03575, partial [Burkholderiaceae bacterium]
GAAPGAQERRQGLRSGARGSGAAPGAQERRQGRASGRREKTRAVLGDRIGHMGMTPDAIS